MCPAKPREPGGDLEGEVGEGGELPASPIASTVCVCERERERVCVSEFVCVCECV